MIDFSKLRRLTIPEGEVKQIADKSGNVLWRYMEKLAAPVIRLETVADALPQLLAPTIRLETVLPKLAAPIIRLDVVEDTEPDVPILPVQLAAPTIYLDVVEDEPDVPDEPIKLVAPVISLYTEPVEPDVIEPIVLEVEKITADTYAAETTYEDEQFILLDIYPEAADSVVDVTYGGLTKRLTFSGTNAQQVFFGTFNGVSDEVETPASGTLTIEGGCGNFAIGTYAVDSETNGYCSCITEIVSWGDFKSTSIVDRAFYECEKLVCAALPSSITNINDAAFYKCSSLVLTELPSSVTRIGVWAFEYCIGITSITIPSSVTTIAGYAFKLNTGYTRTITILSEIPATTVGFGAFDDLGTNNIIVPAGFGETYKAANGWSKYADYITEATESKTSNRTIQHTR